VKKALLSGAVLVSASFALPWGTDTASAQDVASAPDPNAKICQVITPVGSRLGGKKICATRAEWEEKKRADREATEKAQTQLCVINPMTGKC
jgi:hypothetical protein